MAPVRPQSQNVVEVVDTFGDTVASVTHLRASNGPDRRAFLLGGAIATLLVAFMCFAHALGVASSNKSAFHRHVASGKVAHDFRPVRMSPAVDWVGGLSLAAGLGLAFAYFARRRRYQDSMRADCEVGLGTEAGFELVRLEEQGAVVTLPSSFEASFSKHAAEDVLAQAPWGEGGMREFVLPEDDTLLLERGDRKFHLRWVTPANGSAVSAPLAMDSRLATYIGGTAGAALLFIALLNNLKPDEKRLFGESYGVSDRMIAVSTKAYEDAIEQERKEDKEAGDDGNQIVPAEASEAGAKGTSGIEKATAARAAMSIKDRGTPPSLSNRKQARTYAKQAGVLGLISDRELFTSLGSVQDFASGDGVIDAYGGFEGGPVGDQIGVLSGSWGNDVTGMGPYGTVKVGNRLGNVYATSATCDDDRPCATTGGMVKLRGHKGRPPAPTFGPVNSSGGLDKAIIARYIKRKRERVRHCYEKRLLVKPDLAGSLTVSFSIGGNGSVIGAAAKGLGDEPLQSCIAEVVKGIKFPSTDEGSVVNVRYPFTFQSAGG